MTIKLGAKRIAASIAAAAVCIAFGVSGTAMAADRPNIVVLLADDLGSADVGFRGSPIRTPNLDSLAKSGATLNQYYVQPICSPTRAAFLTGRYPYRYGLQNVLRPWATTGLPLTERLLSQGLQSAGYETAIVGKWHLGFTAPEFLPTRRGFTHQYGHYNGALDYFTHDRDGGHDWHRDDQASYDEGYSTHLIGREAVRRITERDKAKPLFLYVPFNGVHGPLQVPAEYSDPYRQFTGKRKTYAGMVTAVDEAVGQIVAALREQKIEDNTLIVFSSDNGGPAPGRVTSNGNLRAGKGTVYEGGVRTCAFATWPGRIPAGSTVETPLHAVDWYPTLLTLTGAKAETQLPLDGVDAWPVLTGKAATTGRDAIVLNSTARGGAIRVGDWKLILNGGGRIAAEDDDGPEADGAKGDASAPTATLFNLADDVSEKNDVAAAHPDVVAKLRSRYDELTKNQPPQITSPKPKNYTAPKVWQPSAAK